jgi:serine/tyrosine/threonine adenylyltransferase
MQNLREKKFRNEFTETFPGDESGDLSPRQTPGKLFSKTLPTPVQKPALLAWQQELANELGLNKPDAEDIEIVAGNKTTSSMYPYAACYAGHQFGNWAGQLGDGRAITLGELETENGSWELQLKGAGKTAYSRRGDGRAVLRSSVREFLMSEAMYYLGIPTTRALSLVKTGDMILRDMFYDGNAAYEPGAIVMRVSPSFLRFGNFEILTARQETENLENLVNWTIEKYYPHLQGEDKIIRWFEEVVDRTAALMVEWQRVGFVHGVMNTDNMSILGLTIDYGPYSFVDDYDPKFTPNTTDLPGRRYAFGKQPFVAQWNLSCLAGAIAPLFRGTEQLVQALNDYENKFYSRYYRMMGNKLGLGELKEEDKTLIHQFEETLAAVGPDMAIFYQLLIDLPEGADTEEAITEYFKDSFYNEPNAGQKQQLYVLISSYLERLKENDISKEESKKLMKNANPRFILRNYLLHQAIEELENGNEELFRKLEQAIKEPYSNNWDEFFSKRPDWASQKAGCSMLSCSS